jgi:hypothetical protein
VILLGIIGSLTRNQPDEWVFRRELTAQGRDIHSRNGIPPGITSSCMEADLKFKYENVIKMKNKPDMTL